MNEKYKEYLKAIEVISEEDFNEVLKLFPVEEVHFSNTMDNYHDKEESLSEEIFDEILSNKWSGVIIDAVDWNTKTYSILGVQYIEDLEEINDFFKEWTLKNYELLKEDLSEKDIDETSLRVNIINKINDITNKEDLIQIAKYVYSK